MTFCACAHRNFSLLSLSTIDRLHFPGKSNVNLQLALVGSSNIRRVHIHHMYICTSMHVSRHVSADIQCEPNVQPT